MYHHTDSLKKTSLPPPVCPASDSTDERLSKGGDVLLDPPPREVSFCLIWPNWRRRHMCSYLYFTSVVSHMLHPAPNLLNFSLLHPEWWYTWKPFVLAFSLPSFRYMEEVIESTFSLLSFQHGSASAGTEKALEPIHLLALLDIKATWFKKWMVSIARVTCAGCISALLISVFVAFSPSFTLCSLSHILFRLLVFSSSRPSQHGYYSRTVVLRLLERKYKCLVSDGRGNQYFSVAPLYF